MNKDLDEIAARFEIHFQTIESDRIDYTYKIDAIDDIVDYFYPINSEDFDIDGVLREDSEVFKFIEFMMGDDADCREIVREKLEAEEDYDLLSVLFVPLSDVCKQIIEPIFKNKK